MKNMRILKTLMAIVFVLLLSQCAKEKSYLKTAPTITTSQDQDPEYISEEEQRKITKEIEETLDEYQNAYNRHDLNWFHNFWSNEKGFAQIGDGRVVTNYDTAVTKTYKDGFLIYKKIINKRSSEHPYVLSKKAVSYAFTIDCIALSESGDTIRVRNSLLYVFRKSGGKWKVVQAAGSLTTTKDQESDKD